MEEYVGRPESNMNIQLSSNGIEDFITDDDLVEVMADEMESGKLNTEAGVETVLDEKQAALIKKAK